MEWHEGWPGGVYMEKKKKSCPFPCPAFGWEGLFLSFSKVGGEVWEGSRQVLAI